MFEDNAVIKKLKENRVGFFVVGVGGIGFNLVKYLIDEGIDADHIFCIDDDIIDFPTMYKYGYTGNIKNMETKVDALRSMLYRRENIRKNFRQFETRNVVMSEIAKNFVNGRYYYGYLNQYNTAGYRFIRYVGVPVIVDCLDNSDYSKMLYDELKELGLEHFYYSVHYDGNHISIFNAQRAVGDSSGYNIGTSTMLSQLSSLLAIFYIAESFDKTKGSLRNRAITTPYPPLQVNLADMGTLVESMSFFKTHDIEQKIINEKLYHDFLSTKFPEPNLVKLNRKYEGEVELGEDGNPTDKIKWHLVSGEERVSPLKLHKRIYSDELQKYIIIRLDLYRDKVFAPLIYPSTEWIEIMKADKRIYRWAISCLLADATNDGHLSELQNYTLRLLFSNSNVGNQRSRFLTKMTIVEYIMAEVNGEKNPKFSVGAFSKKFLKKVFKKVSKGKMEMSFTFANETDENGNTPYFSFDIAGFSEMSLTEGGENGTSFSKIEYPRISMKTNLFFSITPKYYYYGYKGFYKNLTGSLVLHRDYAEPHLDYLYGISTFSPILSKILKLYVDSNKKNKGE